LRARERFPGFALRGDGLKLSGGKLTGDSRADKEAAMLETVTRDELKQGLAEGRILLLDVREAHEFAAGRIPGAVNFPLSSFDPARLPRENGKRIVFTCRSGQRTQRAIEMARLGGRRDADTHYAGSMNDWLAAGEPVER
jgi:rhodanese-related sulfurtransferase